MVNTNSTLKIRRNAAAAPILPGHSRVAYVDDDRDMRDFTIASAIRTAIDLIDNDDGSAAANVLRLAEYQLKKEWPLNQEVKCVGDVRLAVVDNEVRT